MNQISFKYAMAQATGTTHIEAGVRCQDAIRIATVTVSDGTSWFIAAVADGVGSAELAELGAHQAADSFVRAMAVTLSDALPGTLDMHLVAAVALARFEIDLMAEVDGRDAEAYGTTLLGIATNGARTGVVQIGDGVIVAGPDWRLLLEPQRGEYANEATFLTCAGWKDALQVRVIDAPLDTVVLMTDGLEEVTILNSGPHADFFTFVRCALANAETTGEDRALSERLRQLLDGPSVRSRTHDDTTLIAIRAE